MILETAFIEPTDHCLTDSSTLVAELFRETLDSKTINSRLAQNDEVERDKG